MTKSLEAIIADEAITAVSNVGGDYRNFEHWNYILALYGLEPLDSFVARPVVHIAH